jgi:hypothetical protein
MNGLKRTGRRHTSQTISLVYLLLTPLHCPRPIPLHFISFIQHQSPDPSTSQPISLHLTPCKTSSSTSCVEASQPRSLHIQRITATAMATYMYHLPSIFLSFFLYTPEKNTPTTHNSHHTPCTLHPNTPPLSYKKVRGGKTYRSNAATHPKCRKQGGGGRRIVTVVSSSRKNEWHSISFYLNP